MPGPVVTTIGELRGSPALRRRLTALAPNAPADAPLAVDGHVGAVALPTPAGWSVHPLGDDLTTDRDATRAIGCVSAVLDGPLRTGGDDAEIHVWIADDGPAVLALGRTTLTARAGLERTRHLLQLKGPLPLAETTDLDVTAFRPGVDEARWVAVNNRAFSWHPEQRDRTEDDVRRIEAEPWFDPQGFLLHWHDGRLLGFCWTRTHRELDPPEGEIFVIGVDPDAHGRGLGRGLTIAGFDHLARVGMTVGMLWVEGDNHAALHLYELLGFREHHRREAVVLRASTPLRSS